jgi:hypothetical protein
VVNARQECDEMESLEKASKYVKIQIRDVVVLLAIFFKDYNPLNYLNIDSGGTCEVGVKAVSNLPTSLTSSTSTG